MRGPDGNATNVNTASGETHPSAGSAGRRGAFPALVTADFVSTTGSEISALAIPWFVLTTTGSPARTGVALAAEFVGLIAFGIPAGGWVARIGARRAMIASDAARAVLIATIPLLHAAGALSYPLLLGILVAVGAFFPAHSAAADLVVASVVGLDDHVLTRASGISGSFNEAGSLLGPVMGGVLIAVTDASSVLLIDAGTYVVSVTLCLLFVRPGRVHSVEGSASDAGSITAGLRRLISDAWLRAMSIGVTVMELAWTGMTAALPVLAYRAFDQNVHLAGLFLGAFGGGSIVGGLLSGRVVRRIGIGRTARVSYVGTALAMWVLVLGPPAPVVIGAVALNGVCTGLFMPALFAEMTLRTPSALRAKTLAAANVVFSVTGPLGFIGVGLLLQHTVSTRPAFLAIAATATLAAVVVLTAPPATRPQGAIEPRGSAASG
jgi:MFS family permease